MEPSSQQLSCPSTLCDELFGNTETLQDNLQQLFSKLYQRSEISKEALNAILLQVKQPGSALDDELSEELLSYLESVASTLTNRNVQLQKGSKPVEKLRPQTQESKSSLQVFAVNSQLLAERFRERRARPLTSGSRSGMITDNIQPLALPPTTNANKHNAARSQTDLFEKTTTNLEAISPAASEENVVDSKDNADLEDCEKACGSRETVETNPLVVGKAAEKDMIEEKASAFDPSIMKFCSTLVGSSILAVVNALTFRHLENTNRNVLAHSAATCLPQQNETTISLETKPCKDPAKDEKIIATEEETKLERPSNHRKSGFDDLPETKLQESIHHAVKQGSSEQDAFVEKERSETATNPQTCSSVRKINIPESAQAAIEKAITSLHPDTELQIQKTSFFDLDDTEYGDAVKSIRQHVGEFDYCAMMSQLENTEEPSFPKYNPQDARNLEESTESVTCSESDSLLGSNWKQRLRTEVRWRLSGCRVNNLAASMLQKCQRVEVNKPNATSQSTQIGVELSSVHKHAHYPDPKATTRAENIPGRKRYHVEISNTLDQKQRSEIRVEDVGKSRKKPKPQIAFGTRVYNSSKENKITVEEHDQTVKKTVGKKKRPRSATKNLLHTEFDKMVPSSPISCGFPAEDTVVDTLVDVLLSHSLQPPSLQETSVRAETFIETSENDIADSEVQETVQEIMHLPMLDVTNHKETLSTSTDQETDFVQLLMDLIPISQPISSDNNVENSQLKQELVQVKDPEQTLTILTQDEPKNEDLVSKGEKVLSKEKTELVNLECNSLRENQPPWNSSSCPAQDADCMKNDPKPLLPSTIFSKDKQSAYHPNQATTQVKRLWRAENHLPETFTSSEDQETSVTSASGETTPKTGTSSTKSSGAMDQSSRSIEEVKKREKWKELKKRQLKKQRDRVFSKCGIYDPLLFTSSDICTTSESEFSTHFTKVDVDASYHM